VNKVQRLMLVILIVLGAHSVKFAQVPHVALKRTTSLADLALSDVYIKKSNLPLTLAEIADYYKVPIGIEVSPDDDLLKERNITLQMNRGTLRDVLNAIVSQNPLYAWDVQAGVINVFPKGDRDPLLKAVLETKIEAFRIPPKTDRFSFRETLTKSSEVKGTLAAFEVEADNEVFLLRDFATLGHGFSLDTSLTTVKTILNLVIRDSETKYWIANREGDRKQYLLLNF
jgi:hypothetical protein